MRRLFLLALILTLALTLLPTTALDGAAATAAASTEDFGTVNLGSSATHRRFELFTGGIRFTGFAITGANAGDFAITDNSCATKALSDTACGYSIVFAPKATGSRTAALTVSCSDRFSCPQTITLTGVGGGAAPSFNDVPANYWAYQQITAFAERGITTGCDANLYCPERGVTRAEMAVFLDRTLGYRTPPTPAAQRFADVPPGYWAYAFIDQFAQLGITSGCAPGEFCPDRGVTRAEMAAFLIRALKASQLTPATPTFADVPADHPQYGYIEALVARGITTGCGEDGQGRRLYCPERGVTRAEMAVFIIRAFTLE